MMLAPSAAMRWMDMPYLPRAVARTVRPRPAHHTAPPHRVRPELLRVVKTRRPTSRDACAGGPSRVPSADEARHRAGLLPALLVEREELPVGREHGVRTVAGQRQVEGTAEADVRRLLLVELDDREGGPRGRGDRHGGEVVGQLLEGAGRGEVE